MRERIIRAVAGSMVLISTLLTYFININWIWLAVFVGANLLQSSFTKFCPLDKILDVVGGQDRPQRKTGNHDKLGKGGCCPVE
jgi:Inner membrane protein YgaP-like, transmembrane domain